MAIKTRERVKRNGDAPGGRSDKRSSRAVDEHRSAPSFALLSPADLLTLQTHAGNRAVTRLFSGNGGVQRDVTIDEGGPRVFDRRIWRNVPETKAKSLEEVTDMVRAEDEVTTD